MGFRFGSSLGVAKKISKLPSWRVLHKNHAQLQFKQGFPCKLKMSWVWVWPNFKISLVRGSYELPIEQIKQTVNANHGQPVSQLASQPASESVSQRANHPASQPASESVSQPVSQSVKWVSQSSQSVSQSANWPTNHHTGARATWATNRANHANRQSEDQPTN